MTRTIYPLFSQYNFFNTGTFFMHLMLYLCNGNPFSYILEDIDIYTRPLYSHRSPLRRYSHFRQPINTRLCLKRKKNRVIFKFYEILKRK